MRGKRMVWVIVGALFLFCSRGDGQAEETQKSAKKVAIRAGRLIDGRNDAALVNALILIEGEQIVSVGAGGAAPAGVEVIRFVEGHGVAWAR
jgi:hypothetical protein